MIEAVNKRDFEGLDAVVAANVQRHSAATPGVVVENLEQFKAFLRQDLAAVPDAQQTVNMIFSDGDMVAVHATYEGTQSGPMGPFPPSGRRLTLPFIGLLRIENGKIAEIWVEWDNVHALTQLGHLPPPSRGNEAPDTE
jgi:predicted ester cyclase